MMQYAAVYRISTGQFLWRLSGPQDTINQEVQKLPDDMALVVMPFGAYATVDTDLAPLKAAVQALVDDAAGRFRRNFITDIPGQAETYLYKANEARAWQADNAIETFFLAPEAAARGMTIAALATEVLTNEAAWRPIGGQVEALRVAAKATIASASTIGAIVAAAQVEWSSALPPAPAEAE